MSLHPVVGHREARAALAHAHLAGVLPTALLLHGLRGVGKQRVALWLTQLQVCEAPTEAGPCDACRSCRMALRLEHPDLHWYMPLRRPKGASGAKLVDALEVARIDALADFKARPLRPSQGDELRGLYLGTVKGLRKRALVRPTMAASQVFIIGDAEFLVPQEASPEAANALLKLLEEPPAGTYFVLTSSEPGRLLPTIRSRTVPLHLTPLSHDEVEGFLSGQGGIDAETASRVAGLAQGSIGRALGFLPDGEEPGPLEALRQRALHILEAALSDDLAPGFSTALGYSPAGARSLVELFGFVEEWLRDLAAVAARAEAEVLGRDALESLRGMVREWDLSPADITLAMPALEDARELSRGNVNPQLVIADTVRRMRRALRPATRATTGVGG